MSILPYSDDIIVKIISGQTILDALEHGVRLLPQKSARFPQVSGLKYKIDMKINSSVIVDNANVFVKVDGERRVYDVYVGSEKLDPKKIIVYLHVVSFWVEEMGIQCLLHMK